MAHRIVGLANIRRALMVLCPRQSITRTGLREALKRGRIPGRFSAPFSRWVADRDELIVWAHTHALVDPTKQHGKQVHT